MPVQTETTHSQQAPDQTPTPPPAEALNTDRGVDQPDPPSATEPETPEQDIPQQNPEENPARVPYARFQQMVEERNALQERLEAFEAAEQERQDAELSDLERAQNQATQLQEQLTTAQERIQDLEEAHRQLVLNGSIERAARDARNIQQVITLLRADTDLSQRLNESIQDDDTVDDAAVLTVVDDFRKENGHLFGSGHPGNPAHDEGRHSEIDQKALKAAMEADMLRLRGVHF